MRQTPMQRNWPSYWLNAGRVIRADRTITDLSCQEMGTWPIQGDWYVAGTVPAKGWMLLRKPFSRTVNRRINEHNDYAIADRDSHRLTSSVLWQVTFEDSNAILAQGAEVVCN
jgi:hypothetical protein